MRDKKIFVLKIVWRKSIASLHRLTQAVQLANLRRTAGDPTWVCHENITCKKELLPNQYVIYIDQIFSTYYMVYLYYGPLLPFLD